MCVGLLSAKSMKALVGEQGNKIVPFAGYVYMNGDIGKIPSGAVYTVSPEPQTSAGVNDYR